MQSDSAIIALNCKVTATDFRMVGQNKLLELKCLAVFPHGRMFLKVQEWNERSDHYIGMVTPGCQIFVNGMFEITSYVTRTGEMKSDFVVRNPTIIPIGFEKIEPPTVSGNAPKPANGPKPMSELRIPTSLSDIESQMTEPMTDDSPF